jgi:hypothetical protein
MTNTLKSPPRGGGPERGRPGTRPDPWTPQPIRIKHRRTTRDVMRGLGAFAALAVIIVGIPLALVRYIGWPLPHHWPNSGMFDQPITTQVVLNALAVIVWLAWAQFAACVVVELVAAIRGVGMPAKVPAAGPSQFLARQLIAALLMITASAASFVPSLSRLGAQTTPTLPHAGGPPSVTAPYTPGSALPTSPAGTSSGISSSASPSSSAASSLPAVRYSSSPAVSATGSTTGFYTSSPTVIPPPNSTLVSPPGGDATKVYTVEAPEGLHHDTLWGIAERYLGDGRRYPEIFDLNKDRVQPDGSMLTNASLIRPGWILVLPADASGPGLITELSPAPSTPPAPPPATSTQPPGASTPPSNSPSPLPSASQQPPSPSASAHPSPSSSPTHKPTAAPSASASATHTPSAPASHTASAVASSAQPSSQAPMIAAPAVAGSVSTPTPSPSTGSTDPSTPSAPPTQPPSSSPSAPTQPSPTGLTPVPTVSVPPISTPPPTAPPSATSPTGDPSGATPSASPTTQPAIALGAGNSPLALPPGPSSPPAPASSGSHRGSHAPEESQPPSADNRLLYGLAGAPLLAAGLLKALGRQRRRQLWYRAFGSRPVTASGDGAVAEESIRIGAGEDEVWFLDLALRGLAAALAAEERSAPDAIGLRLSDGGVELLLAHRADPDDPDDPSGAPPGPWRLSKDGRAWFFPRPRIRDIDPEAARRRFSPYPGMVSIGVAEPGSDGAPGQDRIMVDLEEARGIVAVEGPDDLRRAFVAALAVELATNSWSDRMTVTLVGFPGDLTPLAPARIKHVATLDEVLPAVEAEAAARSAALNAAGLGSVLEGRCRASHASSFPPHFVLVAEEPHPAILARLTETVVTAKRVGMGFVVAGAAVAAALSAARGIGLALARSRNVEAAEPDAEDGEGEGMKSSASARASAARGGASSAGAPTWHLVLDDTGRVTVPTLGLTAEAQVLPADQYRAVIALFRSVCETEGTRIEPPRIHSSQPAIASHPYKAGPPTLRNGAPPASLLPPNAPAATSPAAASALSPVRSPLAPNAPSLAGAAASSSSSSGFSSAAAESVGYSGPLPDDPPAVYVTLLGALGVNGARPIAPDRELLLREALVFLLNHRDGVHPRVLAAALWPRGASADVAEATFARLAAWLGTDADGRANLEADVDGRLCLGRHVWSDWDRFQALVSRALYDGSIASERDRAELLATALGLVRGPFLDDREPGHYAWLAYETAESQIPAFIADTALRLADAMVAIGDAEVAIASIKAGMLGSPDDEELWRGLLRATAATGDVERLTGAIEGLCKRTWYVHGVEGLNPRTESLVDELLPSWRDLVSV